MQSLKYIHIFYANMHTEVFNIFDLWTSLVFSKCYCKSHKSSKQEFIYQDVLVTNLDLIFQIEQSRPTRFAR